MKNSNQGWIKLKVSQVTCSRLYTFYTLFLLQVSALKVSGHDLEAV